MGEFPEATRGRLARSVLPVALSKHMWRSAVYEVLEAAAVRASCSLPVPIVSLPGRVSNGIILLMVWLVLTWWPPCHASVGLVLGLSCNSAPS